jgi:hypothetical protein
MMDDYFEIIVDEDYFEESYPLSKSSGLNFLTGAYGLMLCAEEMVKKRSKEAYLIDCAIDAIDDLEDYTELVFEAMENAYPPSDLSLDGLLGLARSLIKLRDFIDKHPGVVVAVEDIDRYYDYNVQIKTLEDEIERLKGEVND